MNLEELTQEGLNELTSQLEIEQQARAAAEAQVAEKDTVLAERDTRITELEQTAAERDSQIATLNQAIADENGKISSVSENFEQALSAYKNLAIQANPSIPAELITGNTIDALNQSLESAKTLISEVRERIEAEIASGKIPAGAPARTAPDLESLSPREKIQYAITKGGKA